MSIKIRKIKSSEYIEASNLIYKVFKKYNGSEYYEKEAFSKMLNTFDTSKKSNAFIIAMFKRTSIVYVAIDKDKIVGVIRGSVNKISSLMVDGKYHRMGIGYSLVDRFEKEAIKQNSDFIKIRPSLYAVRFYQSCGYKKTTGVRNFMGVKIFNMKKNLMKVR